MANSDYIEYELQVIQEEHDTEQTGTKKVMLYGVDSSGVKRRIAVDKNGYLMIVNNG